DESLTTSGRICKLHPKEALCISRERKYFIHCTVLVVKDAIGCHLLLDTHLHRSVQGCCCIQGLLWRTRGNLLVCDYSLFYGIFPLPYCKVLLAKTSETIIIQTISVLFCVYDIGG
ncbi:hypothetical protein EMCRGX_G009511, partial [Ephydatia muelleri]